MVVDGRGRDVDLGGPVGRVPIVGPAHELVALDEIPPARRRARRRGRRRARARSGSSRAPSGRRRAARRGAHRRAGPRDRRRSTARAPATVREPVRIVHEPAATHRDALGEAEVHRAQQPRQLAVETVEVDRVTELVQHRLGPALARHVVAEHAHVVAAVDVDAERVLDLAVARLEVAAADDIADVEADARRTCASSARRDRRRRSTRRGRRRRPRAGSGRTGRRSATAATPRRRSPKRAARRASSWSFSARNGAAVMSSTSASVAKSRGSSKSVVASVSREVIAEAERPRGLVAQPDEVAQIGRDLGADRLRRFPRAAPVRRVGGSAQDVEDRVVVDRLAVDRAAMAREARLDVGLQLDDLAAQIGADLVRRVRLLEQRRVARATSGSAIGARSASRIAANASDRRARSRAPSRRRRAADSSSSLASQFASHHALLTAVSSGSSSAVQSATSASGVIARGYVSGTRCAGSRGSSGAAAARRARPRR